MVGTFGTVEAAAPEAPVDDAPPDAGVVVVEVGVVALLVNEAGGVRKGVGADGEEVVVVVIFVVTGAADGEVAGCASIKNGTNAKRKRSEVNFMVSLVLKKEVLNRCFEVETKQERTTAQRNL